MRLIRCYKIISKYKDEWIKWLFRCSKKILAINNKMLILDDKMV
jgi:hypothetical protein